jgi:hypothetical protein
MAFKLRNRGGVFPKSEDSDIEPENEKGMLKTFFKTMKRIFVKWITSSKGRIEILWSVMAGILFSMLVPLIRSASAGGARFDLGRWFKYFDRFYIDEFIFGFCFTLILIWSINQYRRLENKVDD